MTVSPVSSGSRVRNYGIDVLKLASMLMTVFLHVLGAAGVLENLTPLSAEYDLLWLLECACYGAVNCFALATGYLMGESSIKAHRLLTLWLQVAFYTIGITVVFRIFRPEVVTGLYWKMAFRPVTALNYWYFTAYFAMYLFLPFYNKLIAILSKQEHARLILCGLVLTLLTVWAKDDIFRLHNGYTMVWLSILYFMGSYLKKYPLAPQWGSGRWLLVYAGTVLLTWAGKLISVRWGSQYAMAAELTILLNYISPTVFLSSVALFQACIRLHIRQGGLQKIITLASPAAFSVYLMHCHPLIWHQMIVGRFTYFASYSVPKLIVAVGASGVVIWLCGLVIDRLRILLFKLLHIDAFSKAVTDRLNRLM